MRMRGSGIKNNTFYYLKLIEELKSSSLITFGFKENTDLSK